MFDIIDSEKCFSQDISPYRLVTGEFDVCEPYFTAKKPTAEPTKKRKKANTPSICDIETQKRHEELRPHLITCLEDLLKVWYFTEIKQPRTVKTVEVETIDFPSMQAMVEKARIKFCSDEDADEFELTGPVTTEIDLFGVFNLICINNQPILNMLRITPDCQYIIPPKSSFLMGSIANTAAQLGNYVEKIGGADIIVMDPPWPNKSVSRSSEYGTQDIYDLYTIPISQMISSKDSIVAIWVTNKPKFRNFIINKLFPSWKLECVAEWVWLKVTTQAECIFPIDSMHKKPYEQLIIGRPIKKRESSLPKMHTIVSVPSVRHSRKPPLQDILLPYLDKTDPVCVELFARCLIPGWISWGNECLKFQHLNYFEKQEASS